MTITSQEKPKRDIRRCRSGKLDLPSNFDQKYYGPKFQHYTKAAAFR